MATDGLATDGQGGLTEARVCNLLAKAAEAAPGPWGRRPREGGRRVTLKRTHWEVGSPAGGVAFVFGDTPANADFMAAADPFTVAALARDWLRLRAAIAEHRAQKADDRCIEDDDRLYAALGDNVACDRRVGDKVAMLENCRRFIANRCQGGGWKSYAELEAENVELRERLEEAEGRMMGEDL